jgi:hypothetical protein
MQVRMINRQRTLPVLEPVFVIPVVKGLYLPIGRSKLLLEIATAPYYEWYMSEIMEDWLEDSKRDILLGDFRVKKFIPLVDISISMFFGKYKKKSDPFKTMSIIQGSMFLCFLLKKGENTG